VLRSAEYNRTGGGFVRIRRFLLLLAALVALTAWACGGGDDKTDLPGGGEVNVSDDLPDEFPDDFPIYDGADFQGAVTGQQGGVEGLVATWETGDDLDDVQAFYDGEFSGDGPWDSTGDGDTGDSAFWSVQNTGDDKSGFVTVASADGTTTIAVVISDDLADLPTEDDADSGSGDEAPPDDGGSNSGSADLPAEADLPDDFPSDDVPLPDDIRVTNATSFTTAGVTSFLVEFYSQDSVDALAAHFKDELEAKGWSQSFQQESGDGVYAAYAENPDDATGSVVTVTIAESEVDGYNTVAMTVTSQ
jgi:hypothetical protein